MPILNERLLRIACATSTFEHFVAAVPGFPGYSDADAAALTPTDWRYLRAHCPGGVLEGEVLASVVSEPEMNRVLWEKRIDELEAERAIELEISRVREQQAEVLSRATGVSGPGIAQAQPDTTWRVSDRRVLDPRIAWQRKSPEATFRPRDTIRRTGEQTQSALPKNGNGSNGNGNGAEDRNVWMMPLGVGLGVVVVFGGLAWLVMRKKN